MDKSAKIFGILICFSLITLVQVLFSFQKGATGFQTIRESDFTDKLPSEQFSVGTQRPASRRLQSLHRILSSNLFSWPSSSNSQEEPVYYSPQEDEPLGLIRPPEPELLSCHIPALRDLRELLGEVNSHVWDPNTHSWKEEAVKQPINTSTAKDLRADVAPRTDLADAKVDLNLKMELVIKAVDAAQLRIEDKMGLSRDEAIDCVSSAHPVWNFEAVRQKLRAAIVSGPSSEWRTFTAVFGGTSITAGHDTYFNMSFPFVFERFARCSFAAAGLRLLVHNVAIGANDGMKYSLCVAGFYDKNTDLAFWEMEDMGRSGNHDHETAMRNLFSPSLFPRRPAFISMRGSLMSKKQWGEITPECYSCKKESHIYGNLCPDPNCKYIPCKKCRNGTDPPKFPKQEEEYNRLLQHYSEFGTGKIHFDRCVVHRTGDWTFSGSKLIRIGKIKGYYAGWHPGAYGHEMMAMIMVYKILSELKVVAVELLQNKTSFPERGSSSEVMQRVLLSSPQRLPDPVLCSQELCRHPARCFSTYEPRVPQDVPPFNDDPSVSQMLRPRFFPNIGSQMNRMQNENTIATARDLLTYGDMKQWKDTLENGESMEPLKKGSFHKNEKYRLSEGSVIQPLLPNQTLISLSIIALLSERDLLLHSRALPARYNERVWDQNVAERGLDIQYDQEGSLAPNKRIFSSNANDAKYVRSDAQTEFAFTNRRSSLLRSKQLFPTMRRLLQERQHEKDHLELEATERKREAATIENSVQPLGTLDKDPTAILTPGIQVNTTNSSTDKLISQGIEHNTTNTTTEDSIEVDACFEIEIYLVAITDLLNPSGVKSANRTQSEEDKTDNLESMMKLAAKLKKMYRSSCCPQPAQRILTDRSEISKRIHELTVHAREGKAKNAKDLLGIGAVLDRESSPVVDMREFCSSSMQDCPDIPDNSTLDVEDVYKRGSWSFLLWSQSIEAVKRVAALNAGWMDRKFLLQGDRHSQWLVLRFHAHSNSRTLVVCTELDKEPRGYRAEYCSDYKAAELDKDVDFLIDGRDLHGRHSWTRFRYHDHHSRNGSTTVGVSKLTDTCVQLTAAHSLKGSHSLAMRTRRPGKVVRIQQLVWF